MNSYQLASNIHINEYSATPKYQQVTNLILNLVETGKLSINTGLPSINELSAALDISRDTIEKGYKCLRNLGVVTSVPGKGYYVIENERLGKHKICLLFNKWSVHKKIIYDALANTIGDKGTLDLNIYNNNFNLFKKIITNKTGQFSHYVIIPPVQENMEEVREIVATIPSEKVIILDKLAPEFKDIQSAVYEDFDKDIYYALEKALTALSKYKKLKIIFPEENDFPREILNGLKKFCLRYDFNYEIIEAVGKDNLNNGEVYITLLEDSLVEVVEEILNSKLVIGRDIGIISYNDTPIKRIFMNGITTISTDFVKLGTETARIILNNLQGKINVPFYLTLRNSL